MNKILVMPFDVIGFMIDVLYLIKHIITLSILRLAYLVGKYYTSTWPVYNMKESGYSNLTMDF